ncbi:MAG: TetR/AcrR family transcriptional regulator [Candidatus Riflebacteria bacterium]|nr:TetR/AcrR family transcriptional regulator [Candidatus Riflebacteria bacterium]
MSKRKTKRELLLEAGLDLFCEKGFEKTTIDDIIARADCGKGTFYRYFDNKDSLYSELENEFNTLFRQEVNKNCHSGMGLRQYTTAALTTFLRVFRKYQRLGMLRFIREQSLEPDARKASISPIMPYLMEMRDYFATAITSGAVRNINPENVVGLIIGATHFFLLRDFKLNLPYSPKDIEDTVDIILNGVARP